MRDKWMNTGYEDDELRPYVEPQQDFKDHNRIGEDTIGILPTSLCATVFGNCRPTSGIFVHGHLVYKFRALCS